MGRSVNTARETENEKLIRNVKDCLKQMRDTTNPAVYFSCYNLVLSKLSEIILINERTMINGKFAYEIHTDLFVDMNKHHNEFINKLFSLKLEDNLVYQIWDYGHFVEDEAGERLCRHLRNIKKNYHFCKLRFKEGGRLYTYITKDETIIINDIVVIKQGNNEVFARVMDTFDAMLRDIDVSVLELGCVDRKMII